MVQRALKLCVVGWLDGIATYLTAHWHEACSLTSAGEPFVRRSGRRGQLAGSCGEPARRAGLASSGGKGAHKACPRGSEVEVPPCRGAPGRAGRAAGLSLLASQLCLKVCLGMAPML